MGDVGLDDWGLSRCVNIRVDHQRSGFFTDRGGEFSHAAAVCWSSPGEYRVTVHSPKCGWKIKGMAGNSRSLLSFEMLNHTCASICFWFVPSLSLAAPFLSPPRPLFRLPCLPLGAGAGARSSPKQNRAQAQARKCVSAVGYWKQVGSERANPPRHDGREEAADSPNMSPSPEKINPQNAIKILPALIKQHCSLEDSLCTQMFLRSPCLFFFSLTFEREVLKNLLLSWMLTCYYIVLWCCSDQGIFFFSIWISSLIFSLVMFCDIF